LIEKKDSRQRHERETGNEYRKEVKLEDPKQIILH
jgi:hypothetical protein